MSIVAKAGGFLIVPTLMSRIVLPRVVKEDDSFDKAAMKGALTYAAIAAASFYATKHVPRELTEFAMGATWGAGIASATLALAPLYIPKDKQASTLSMYKRGLGLPAATVSGVGGNTGAQKVIAALTGH